MRKCFLKSSRLLHWRLTRSYMLISILAWLLVELLLLLVLGLGMHVSRSFLLITALKSNANVAGSLLSGDHGPDHAGLNFWLQQQQRTVDKVFSYTGLLAIVNREGRVIASTGTGTRPPSQGTLLSAQLPNQSADLLHTYLDSQGDIKPITHESASTGVVALVPLEATDAQADGILVMQAKNLKINASLWLGIGGTFLLPASVVIVLCVGAAGAVFGAVTSRPLIRRFGTLADAADHWSHGNFSVLVHDPGGDEIGRLTRRLNHMAEQLQHLVQVRQEQAALDERGRMARDLHDSIKQQLFALFMQISGAKALLLQGKEGALPRLERAEDLLGHVQDDLTNLIHELRPAMLEGKRFPQALREQIEQWEELTGIDAVYQVQGMKPIPLQLEEALYRLTQEALSNVARHSEARTVRIQLILEPDRTTLEIADNGRGCHVLSKIGKGIGLLSMSERLLPFGGEVRYQSKPEQGFVVTATVPGQEQQDDEA
ncbi:histidine kinase [Paenibacillus beijingensis]|uniref:sensor histidine kinase n=1 Tax=Paenibacillus beijingensis TaxID=1126833 RepID=UPI00069866A4|nr:histidine kinase [Paenibacillus beijingensis]